MGGYTLKERLDMLRIRLEHGVSYGGDLENAVVSDPGMMERTRHWPGHVKEVITGKKATRPERGRKKESDLKSSCGD